MLMTLHVSLYFTLDSKYFIFLIKVYIKAFSVKALS